MPKLLQFRFIKEIRPEQNLSGLNRYNNDFIYEALPALYHYNTGRLTREIAEQTKENIANVAQESLLENQNTLNNIVETQESVETSGTSLEENSVFAEDNVNIDDIADDQDYDNKNNILKGMNINSPGLRSYPGNQNLLQNNPEWVEQKEKSAIPEQDIVAAHGNASLPLGNTKDQGYKDYDNDQDNEELK